MLIINEARAEPVFVPGMWSGDLTLDGSYTNSKTEMQNSPTNDSTQRRFDEQVGIKNQGFYVIDPRLLTGNLGLTFDQFQERDSSNGDTTSENGTLVGYAFGTDLFSSEPYSGRLFANKNHTILNQAFGGRSDVTFETHGGAIRLRDDSILRDWGVPYFSSTLGAHQEHTQETTDVLTQHSQRNETRNVVSFDANKGYETADLGFTYEYTDDTDTDNPENAFTNQSVGLIYSLDFGPTLNRRWDSRLLSSTFKGKTTEQTFSSADEGLRIDHNADLSSYYHYLFARVDTPTGITTTQSASAVAQQKVNRNLNATYTAQSTNSVLPNNEGDRNNYSGQLDLNYHRNLTPQERVTARVGGRYQIDVNDLTTSQINVVDEPHIAPTPLGGNAGFNLNNPFVINSTIVMVDGIGRLPTTLGVDYDIQQQGNFTKIIPLPTSAVIHAGDLLAVSYTYQVAPSIRYSTDSYWMSGGMDFQWIAFSLSHEVVDQTLLGGQDGQFLQNQRTDDGQVELRGETGPYLARASAGYTVLDSTNLAYTRWQFGQFLSYRPGYDLTLRFDAHESVTDYTLPIRTSKAYSAYFTLDLISPSNWYTNAFVGTRVTEDSDLPTETLREAGVKSRRTIGLTDILPSLTWSNDERGSTQTTTYRIDLRLVRRFQ